MGEAGALGDAGESVGGNGGLASAGSGDGGDESAGTSGNSDAGASGDAGAGPCGGADLDSDPKHCGTCDNDCTSSPNLDVDAPGITCKAGKCVIPDSACVDGKKHCSASASDVCETDVTTSAQCGACGVKCDSVQVCSDGKCADSCPGGATKCSSGQSVGCYALATATDNCGACGKVCTQPASNGTAACEASACKVLCSSGFHQCNASAQCEANDDANHCGSTCKQCETNDPNATPKCTNNTCASACNTGYQYCGFCVAKNDPTNCGSCGNVCGNTKNCINGSCALKDGYECTVAGDCSAGSSCIALFLDADNDGFGAAGSAKKVCASVVPPVGYATNALDCCDTDNNAKPGQGNYFAVQNTCGNFDYDCSLKADLERTNVVGATHCNLAAKTCTTDNPGWIGGVPACGANGTYQSGCGVGMVSTTPMCFASIDVNYPTQRCH